MRLNATMIDMETTTTRQVAGQLVRDEIARKGWTHAQAADRMRLSRSTLAHVMAGKDTVTAITYRQVEGVLDFPRHLLTYIADADAETIGRIDMESDLRRHILDSLAAVASRTAPKGGVRGGRKTREA